MVEDNNKIIKSFFFSFFVNGMIVLSIGSILIYIVDDYNLSFSEGSLLISVSSFSFLIFNFFSGAIISLLGRKKSCILVGITFLLTSIGMILSPNYYFLILTMMIFGIGWGINNNLGNVLVTEYSHGSGYSLGLLHTSYAVGAFLIPLIISMFVKLNLGYKIPILIVALFSLILIILFLNFEISDKVESEKSKKISFEFLKNYRYYIFICIFFLYVGSEAGVNNFLITYLVEGNILNKSSAQLILSLFWGLMIFGRFVISHISKHIAKKLLLLIIGTGFFISILFFILLKNPMFVIISISLVGLFMAGIYPVSVSNAEKFMNGSGIESGIMFSCGGLGATLLPLLMGKLTDLKGIKYSMNVVLFGSLFCFIFIVLNYIFSKEKRA